MSSSQQSSTKSSSKPTINASITFRKQSETDRQETGLKWKFDSSVKIVDESKKRFFPFSFLGRESKVEQCRKDIDSSLRKFCLANNERGTALQSDDMSAGDVEYNVRDYGDTVKGRWAQNYRNYCNFEFTAINVSGMSATSGPMSYGL
ncbi:uncharacterized protein I206_105697 [Kwoniella pini CBS 10737]|uniref:Uncharacterized protein n=1 Tax=Kwoniella pini CBS 10737 TaxID=1296096 RepID=A0A1B9I3I5_9TREE|nr:uncharacterized protein I206_03400 [Kwoniella pini CBS 10737]OCF50083.1 hypothetical protein I206_03400 [Kwoniella pini CBS 10737]